MSNEFTQVSAKMTPQHQLQHQKDLGQSRDQAAPQSRYQTHNPNSTAFTEQRSHSGGSDKFHSQNQQFQQRHFREPPRSATVPRRDWPGREGERGGSAEPPKTATFPPQPPTPTQRTHDKLDRLAAEASSYVEEIARESLSSSFGTNEAGTDSPTHHQAIFQSFSAGSLKSQNQQQQQPRLHQLVTVPEYIYSSSNNSPGVSSPSSATSTMSTHFSRNLPRTSSIDSTLSNSSSHGNSHSDSKAQGTSSQDIANLIAAAGSAEALIQALLKDKASAQAQNTQLWRLVDKQRAMILGLNKDLERALKDKERYRKKAKEQMVLLAHHDPRANTESPAPSEQAEGHSPHDPNGGPDMNGLMRDENPHEQRERNNSIELSIAPYPVTPPVPQGKFDNNVHHPQPEQRIPSPTVHINSILPDSTAAPENKHTGAKPDEYATPPKSPKRDLQVPDFSAPLRSPRRVMPPLNLDTNHNKAVKALSPPSPTNGPGLPSNVTPISASSPLSPERIMTPRKKAPPARLELSPTEKMPITISRGSDNDESNYDDDDDNISVDEIPGYEQRRREQELNKVKGEQGEESGKDMEVPPGRLRKDSSTVPLSILRGEGGASEKSERKNSKDDIAELQTSKPLTGARPAPLQLSKLRDVESVGMSPMFPPGHERETIVTTKVIAPRPMSPGLPSSPRPSPNSPLPRPRRNLSSPEPLSPRTLSPRMGLPASPRIGLMPGPFNPHGSPNTPSQATFSSVGLGLVPLSPNPFTQDWSRKDSNSTASPVPELLIEPSAINTIEVRVVSSRMRPARASFLPGSHKPNNDSVFTLGVFSKSTGKEMWRVEKDVGALPSLDARLKHRDLSNKLPDKSLFAGHAPARVDARRIAIEEYFAAVMESPIDEKTAQALCEFFSADVVESPVIDAQTVKEDRNSPDGSSPTKATKEGYLTKRGKNFGGWKARYFILDGPVLRYFETPGGAHLGSIKLHNAQIGRQSQHKESDKHKDGDPEADAENQFRHAFLIMEPKRKDSGSLVRHVLCAESDAERDEWVEALLQWVEKRSEDKPHKAESVSSLKEGKKKAKDKKEAKEREKEEEDLRAVSYEDVTAGVLPASGPSPEESRYGRSPTPTSAASTNSNSHLLTHPQPPTGSSLLPDRGPPGKVISGPTNGSIITDVSMWGNQTLHSDKAHKEAKALKKRSIWGFRGRSSSDLTSEQKNEQHNKVPIGKMVFGVSLEEAISVSRPFGMTSPLPAVVYRCIEYLDAKNAVNEEGIFRLSGSNAVIKGLRDRFNTESDVNLLASDEYYDVHAIAGLLKLYLRELPTNILTTEKREDFLRVTEMDDKHKKIMALNELVHSLPIENYTLLKVLSSHLIRIIDNASVNKMTVRNVGIVFSPTLNIPAQVFALFLQEHDGIFSRDESDSYPHAEPPRAQEQHRGQDQQAQDTRREPKPRQLSISGERPNIPFLEPPKSATLPMSPGFKPPSYDMPLYDRPLPHYEQPRSSLMPPEGGMLLHPPNGMQLQMQEALQRGQQTAAHQLNSQPSRESFESSNSSGGLLDVKSAKARRRESSMLNVMGMGIRKSMLPPRTPQGTVGMVSEDNLYD